LQHENARSPDRGRIILDNDSTTDTRQNFTYRYIILGEFIIAMVGNTDCAARRESLNLGKSIAQFSRLSDPPHSAASLAPRFLFPLLCLASTGARNFPV
jgi:hypothetical protein